MSLLKIFIDSPLAESIGWTLLHTLWEGGIISGLLAAVLAAARSPRVRYTAASAAMLMMLSGLTVTFLCVMPRGMHRAFSRTQSGIQIRNVSGNHVFISENPTPTPVVPWLAPLWMTGVSLIYLRRAADCLSVRRLRTRGVCSAPERWQNEIARLSHRLRISRPILLLESSLADVPVVLGHFRPLILIPVGLLTGLPPEQLEAILLHELAHIRRSDYLMNMLQRLIEGLFFYHPAIWWISRVMRFEREHCCDDVAVFISGNAHEYATALAAIEERRQSVVEPAVAATGGSVVKRIRRLLYPAKTNGTWAPFLAATIFIMLTAVSVTAWQSEPSSAFGHAPRLIPSSVGLRAASPSLAQNRSDDSKVEKKNAISPAYSTIASSSFAQNRSDDSKVEKENAISPAYSKWLNEDVGYIIDDAERVAFLRLTSDAERDKFVEQFWARRNPTPGTPQNAFKEEHYRRIAYANKHFASSTPGWQTDRGHIYIVYGRPDEIDSHPSGNAQIPKPFEIWTYKHVNDIGNGGSITFIDRTGRGDFHLAPGAAPANRDREP